MYESFSYRNHPPFTVDTAVSKLVSEDVIVSEDLENVASDILTELDSTVSSLETDVEFPNKSKI